MATMLVDGLDCRIAGRFLRILSLREELLDDVVDPERFARACREQRVRADILTFTQHMPDLRPR